jgi:hypothetical protein
LGYHFDVMKAAVFPILALLGSTTGLHAAINQPCKAGSKDASIVHIHGRLSVYNGGYPNLRLWQIGTNHLFGIFGDPEDLRCSQSGSCNGDEDTNLPSSLERLNMLDSSVYADFDIRLLEPFRPGHMQATCIVDAHKIVRGKPE